MTTPFACILGVDFSGARYAGRSTWIATGRPDAGTLAIADIRPAASLAGGGTGLHAMLAALRARLLQAEGAIVGLDFPFALPLELQRDEDWVEFAGRFTRRWPDAQSFRQACRAQSGGREFKRRCDREARTPFAAYNLRLFRQTYYGIGHVLAPLAASGRVRIAPVHDVASPSVTLVEACPASLLKRFGLYRRYKGSGPAPAGERREIIDALAAAGLQLSDPALAVAEAQTGGDALDAALAAMCAWFAAGTPEQLSPRDLGDAREARVFF